MPYKRLADRRRVQAASQARRREGLKAEAQQHVAYELERRRVQQERSEGLQREHANFISRILANRNLDTFALQDQAANRPQPGDGPTSVPTEWLRRSGVRGGR